MRQAIFRFYEELNDFLPRSRGKTDFSYAFGGKPSIKDAIEAIGVPHPEVDLILVNGESVTFDYHLRDGDRVSVYPVFESLDITPVNHLRARPLRIPRFIPDVHLGTLARYLRLFGFDTLYENSYDDGEIIALAADEKRAILTRDVLLLKNAAVTRGYWVRSQQPRRQLVEVLDRFDLRGRIEPFSRCMVCNGTVKPVEKEAVIDRLEPNTRQYFDEFFLCGGCGKIYWKGTHFERMAVFVGRVVEGSAGDGR